MSGRAGRWAAPDRYWLSSTVVSGNVLSLGWPLAVLLVAFAGAAAVVVRTAGLGDWHAPITAATRCVIQLAVVSLVIGYVLRSMWWTGAFVGFMILVAAGTSARRITGSLG